MSDYKRLVAYIYLYNKGSRVKNIGFTKVESKNGECRIQISVRGAWMVEGICCKAYIFYREKGKQKGIFLGSLTPKNGAGELKIVTDPEHIMGSEHDLGQMAGILLVAGDDRILATRWDDGPVAFENFVSQEPAASSEPGDGVDSLPEERVEMRDVPEERREAQDVSEELREAEDARLREMKLCVYREEEERRQEKIRRMHSQELTEAKAFSGMFWEKLKKGRERQYPVGRDAGGEYISLEPEDLLCFQDAGKYLVNNSFLLHGFYNYGHLLLGIRPEDQALVLGVPGEFYVQEKIMASLFGFPEFRKMVDAYGNTENMGYWLRKIEEAQEWNYGRNT